MRHDDPTQPIEDRIYTLEKRGVDVILFSRRETWDGTNYGAQVRKGVYAGNGLGDTLGDALTNALTQYEATVKAAADASR